MAKIIRNLASILLLICLVLPFSKCNSSSSDYAEGNHIRVWYEAFTKSHILDSQDNVKWGYETILDSVSFSSERNFKSYVESFFSLIIYLTLFFGPILLSILDERTRSVMTLLCAWPAAYGLFIHIFMSQPLIGVWIALSSWALLVVTNSILLLKRQSG